MFKKAKDFWERLKPTTIWVVGFLLVTYWLFRFLFRFNIFELKSWAGLLSIYLHGPWGLAFGILLVATPAIFIATTVAVWKNKKLLTSADKKKKDEKKSDDKPKADDEKKAEELPLPDGLPEELRAPYLKMRSGALAKGSISPISRPAVDANVAADAPINPAPMPESLMPIPDDFSFDDAPTTAVAAPTFKEITFGAQSPDTNNAPPQNSTPDLKSHLTNLGYKCENRDDIIIATRTDGGSPALAIATHDDSDFWIADGDDWFATGKQKKSPVAALKQIASEMSVAPILYLAQRNIMNLDTLSKSWANDGIRIINTPSDV